MHCEPMAKAKLVNVSLTRRRCAVLAESSRYEKAEWDECLGGKVRACFQRGLRDTASQLETCVCGFGVLSMEDTKLPRTSTSGNVLPFLRAEKGIMKDISSLDVVEKRHSGQIKV